MKKKQKLTDALFERAGGAPQKTFKSLNIAQFLAYKDDISDALGKGWSKKAIWTILNERGDFTGQYNCFTLYVKKYIAVASPLITEEHQEAQKNSPITKQASEEKIVDNSMGKIRTFKHPNTFDITKLMGEE